MSEYKKPLPRPTIESRPYWDGLRQQKLLMPRCDDCKGYWFPPSALCPHCSSEKWTWTETSGRGHIFSYVVYHRVYHPGFADDVPYTVAVIELEEGPRMLSNVIGIPPDKVACDMKVEVRFDPVTDDVTLPKFRPVAAAQGQQGTNL